MRTWFQTLDRILRGDITQLSRLKAGNLDLPARGLTVVVILLGASYGFCMGWFAVFYRDEPEFRQIAASACKVPALFVFTLLVTFPSLYVFNTIVGSRLSALSLLRLLVAALAVTLAVLASFGPIVAFFSLTTTSYPFMVLFNVFLFGVAGLLGLKFLLQTLHRLALVGTPAPTPVPVAVVLPDNADAPAVSPLTETQPQGALEPTPGTLLGKNVKIVFVCWMVVYGFVGMQMSWLLRPFIGHPERAFALFRPKESNFFESIWHSFGSLLW